MEKNELKNHKAFIKKNILFEKLYVICSHK